MRLRSKIYLLALAAFMGIGCPEMSTTRSPSDSTAPTPLGSDSLPSDFLPIGLYCVNDIPSDPVTSDVRNDFSQIAQKGFNWMQSYRFEGSPTGPTWDDRPDTNEAARDYLDSAALHGLKVLMGFNISLPADDPIQLETDLEYIRTRVRALRDHRALLAWNLFDEPDKEEGPLDRAVMEQAYRTIKSLDPIHPVIISNANPIQTDPRSPTYYLDAFDIAMPYQAPIPLGLTRAPHSTDYRNLLAADIAALTAAGKAAIPNVSVYNSHKDYNPLDNSGMCHLRDGELDQAPECLENRYPTVPELRFMFYDALILGARGVSFLCYRFGFPGNPIYEGTPPRPEYAGAIAGDDVSWHAQLPIQRAQWPAISEVSSELQAMAPILLQPSRALADSGISTSIPLPPDGIPIAVMAKQFEGKTYLFTTNPSLHDVEGRIHLDPRRFGNPTITLLPEGRRIVPQEFTFSDVWRTTDTRIYRIDPDSI